MFRQQVLAHQAERLYGEIRLTVPTPWKQLGTFFFVSTFLTLAYFSQLSYDRVETVSGVVQPDKGLVEIFAARQGEIKGIDVSEGDTVTEGQSLATIRVGEYPQNGDAAADQTDLAYRAQSGELNALSAASRATISAQMAQSRARRDGLVLEINNLQEQIQLQNALISSATRDLEKAQVVAKRGFISERDIRSRDENLTSKRQMLSQLQTTLSNKRAEIAELDHHISELRAQEATQLSNVAVARSQLAERVATNSTEGVISVRAPVDGRVSLLAIRAGRRTTTDEPILAIVPAGSRLVAEVNIPSSAIAFVRPGQKVSLAIDAFPFNRFGTVSGQVMTVTQSASQIRKVNGETNFVYPTKIRLDRSFILAYGREQLMIPGMTLQARIKTGRRSVFEWLMDPFLAVQKR